jgi:CBS domain-containing protein
MTEFEDEYSASIDMPDKARATQGAHLNLDDTLTQLSPADPICLSAKATVHEAVQRMLARRQAGVLVVDEADHLIGIFTERDVLLRVIGKDLDVHRTPLGSVMTPNPEALSLGDRVAYALNCMSVAGYRTIPVVDADHRPIGVVTVTDVVRWLADLFPEAILNLPPGDRMKRPSEVDSG